MSDLIDRDALKKAIGKVYACDWDYIEKYFHIAEAVNSLPSAEPERKNGKWIYDTERVMNNGGIYSQYHCSECGFQSISRMNFCGYCGADMRGE